LLGAAFILSEPPHITAGAALANIYKICEVTLVTLTPVLMYAAQRPAMAHSKYVRRFFEPGRMHEKYYWLAVVRETTSTCPARFSSASAT
jgi:hypothetical protein